MIAISRLAALLLMIIQPAIAQTTLSPTTIVVVQPALSDIATRRMNHYSAQVLLAIYSVGDDSVDQLTAISGFRQKVKRLVEAGQQSGFSHGQTAQFFERFAQQFADKAIPAVLLGSSGQLEATPLFNSVMVHFAQVTPTAVDVAAIEASDLAAIGEVAISSPAILAAPQPVQLTEVVPLAVITMPKGPEIPLGAPAGQRAILERVELDGNEWIITVKAGDSLGQYATALYGDTLMFSHIFNANRDVLSTPNSITVGQSLRLPKNI